MSDLRSLFVGYDFCDDYTQISCYNTKYYEPESISAGSSEQFLIPTVLCVREDTKDWLYGAEALQVAEAGEGILVDHLIALASKGDSVTLYEINFAASALLEKFFRKTLSLLKKNYSGNNILQMVITVEKENEFLNQCIYEALGNLGIEKDRVIIKNHACCAMYYTLSQSRELWMNDVGVFHYNGLRLFYHEISINRNTKPFAVTVTTEDYTSSFRSLPQKEEDRRNLAMEFKHLAKTVLNRKPISTLYITGSGFEGSYIDQVLQELCVGRRIFKGQNLYTKGACYLAKEQKGEAKLTDYIFLTEDHIHTSVWISGYVDAKVQDLELLQIGCPWREVNESVEMIVDGVPEVTIHTKSLFAREANTFKLGLEHLGNRPNKMTRLQLTLKCNSGEYLEAKLMDLGFGEMIPATGISNRCLIPLG